jgi:hypothetical protein
MWIEVVFVIAGAVMGGYLTTRIATFHAERRR